MINRSINQGEKEKHELIIIKRSRVNRIQENKESIRSVITEVHQSTTHQTR